MPNDLAVRGLGSLTVLQLHACCGYVLDARFKHKKHTKARLDTQRCNLVIQRQQV
jgi:hypothetical protein